MPAKNVSNTRILPHLNVSVSLEELAKEPVAPALTVHMLKEFRQRLEQSRMKLG